MNPSRLVLALGLIIGAGASEARPLPLRLRPSPLDGIQAADPALPSPDRCVDMESLSPGSAKRGPGLWRISPDAIVLTEDFTLANGAYTSGVATVVASTFAGGSATRELRLNNTALRVVPYQSVGTLWLAYADFGGNVNVRIGARELNLADLSDAHGQVVDGVRISVTRFNAFNYHFGVISFTGTRFVRAGDIAVGGQEFFVDDICWSQLPL